MTESLKQKSRQNDIEVTVRACPRESAGSNGNSLYLAPSALPVAIIEPVGGHGGMHFYDRGLCSGLLAAGCRVSLYTCDETPDPGLTGLTFDPIYRGIYNKRNRALQALRYIACTFSALRHATARGETVCHFHAFNDVAAESIIMIMARLFRRRLLLTVHDVDSFAGHVMGKRLVTRLIYRLADRVIVHNKVSMQELIAIGIQSKRISIIPHGNYLNCIKDMPSKAMARDRLGIGHSAKVVLFFGQIKDTKGLDLLIESLPKVACEVPKVLLLIAGRPWKTDISSFELMIESLNVKALCRLHIGFVPDDEVATYYAATDVVALPYRRIYQSGVLLMAMSYSKPVIVSDLPGMTEIVTDRANGYVFMNSSSDDLARVLIRALNNEEERRLYSERALEYILDHHDWDRIGQHTASLYRDVIAS